MGVSVACNYCESPVFTGLFSFLRSALLLQLHPLMAKIDGLHSVSINIVFRIALGVIITEKKIILIKVGCHDEV